MLRMCEERLNDAIYADIHVRLLKDKHKLQQEITDHKEIIKHYHAHTNR
jgi:hypothetical protein